MRCKNNNVLPMRRAEKCIVNVDSEMSVECLLWTTRSGSCKMGMRLCTGLELKLMAKRGCWQKLPRKPRVGSLIHSE